MAIVLGNDRGFVTTFLAVQVLGAMAVPLNPLFTPEELGRHLAACDVGGDRHRHRAGADAPRLGRRRRLHRAPWIEDVAALTGTPPAQRRSIT